MAAHRIWAVVLIATWTLASGVVASAAPGVAHAGPPPGSAVGPRPDVAEQVYERLLAPCCWLQTLDVHESDLAALLRDEIAQRLEQGERPRVIEDDLALRFGERIRAVPRDHDSREIVGIGVMSLLAIALVVVCIAAFRWVRREVAQERGGAPVESASDRELHDYDEPLERALRDLDRVS